MSVVSRISVTILFFGLYACSTLPLSTTNEDARKLYLNGLSLEKRSSFGPALDAYKKAIRADEHFVEAYEATGRLYAFQGNYRKAADFFERAVALAPYRTDLALPQARVLFNLGRYEEAFGKARAYNLAYPNDPQGLEILAETARALRDPGAESDLIQLTKIDSSNEGAWKQLAQYYFDEKDYALAIPIYDRIIRRDKFSDPAVAFEMAQCFLRLNMWTEANAYLERASTLGSKNSLVPEYRALTAAIQESGFDPTALNHYFSALDGAESAERAPDKSTAYLQLMNHLDLALNLEPNFKLAHQLRARTGYAIGSDEVALRSYQWLMDHQAGSPSDWANAAYLLFRKGEYSKSEASYQRSLTLDPDQPHVSVYLQTVQKILSGRIDPVAYRFFDKGMSATAYDSMTYYFSEAIRRDTSYSEAYLQLGLTQYRFGKSKLAEETLRHGLAGCREPELLADFHYNLGLALFKMDLHDKAIAEFTAAVTIDTADYDAMYFLAKTLADKSDYANAVLWHQRLISKNPEYFIPDENDLESAGLGAVETALGASRFYFDDSLTIGQVNTYRVKIKSQANALLGADANGDESRDLSVLFRETVLDVTDYGVVELALDIVSVEGYALTAKEKSIIGQRFYLRISDVFGITSIYGLMEDNPYSLSRLIIAMMEDLHGNYLHKTLTEGELWRSNQSVFRLGPVDAVGEVDDVTDGIAYGKKYYGVFGSYDAARYGETGYVTIQNRGEAEFRFDVRRRLMKRYDNFFTTKEFRDATAKLTTQNAGYRIEWVDTRYEKLEKPKKVVLESIPYVRQHGPQCAAASLSMVLSYYKQDIDQDIIYARIKSDYAGAQSNDIINYPRSLGKFKTYGYVGTLDELKRRIDQGIPVLVFLSPFGYGHVVVVIGYDETKHQIIMHDPTVANNQAVDYDEFLNEWQQSGNECAVVIPFEQPIVLEGAIASYKAVETKWQGDKAVGDRQYEKALALYNDALRLSPGYEGALEGKMLLHLQKDEFDRASAILDTLLAARPNSIDLILKRAGILLSQYDYDKVLQITRKAKQIDESNINNYVYSASALFSQKKYDEAIEELKQAIRINPLVSTPRAFYASVLAEKGEFDKAYEQMQLALRYEPENVGNYLSLAGVYQTEINTRFLTAQKKAECVRKAFEAIDVIRSANPNLPNLDQIYADVHTLADQHRKGDSLYYENIRKFPEDNGAYNNLAWRYACDGIRLAEAERLSQKSIELSQRNPYYFDTMAWIHLKMAMAFRSKKLNDSAETYFKKAEEELKATIAYDKYSDFAFRHLGVVYWQWGKVEEARSQFEAAIALMPDPSRVCTEIGQDCEEAGLTEPAIRYYQKALELKPNLSYAAYRLAYLFLLKQKDLSQAASFLDRAISRDSANFLYRGLSGILAYEKKDVARARAILESVTEEQKRSSDKEASVNNYYLGLVYRDAGLKDKARAQFDECVRRDPDGEWASLAKNRLP